MKKVRALIAAAVLAVALVAPAGVGQIAAAGPSGPAPTPYGCFEDGMIGPWCEWVD